MAVVGLLAAEVLGHHHLAHGQKVAGHLHRGVEVAARVAAQVEYKFGRARLEVAPQGGAE